jgi:hypothetical protein
MVIAQISVQNALLISSGVLEWIFFSYLEGLSMNLPAASGRGIKAD